MVFYLLWSCALHSLEALSRMYLDGLRFTSAFEAGRKARVDNTVPTFQAGKLSRERLCGRSAEVWRLTISRAPLKPWLQDTAPLWTLSSCLGALVTLYSGHPAVSIGLWGNSSGRGGAGTWETPGPLITSINKLLIHSNSANGIELWFGCSLEVGVYGDRGWLTVHTEDCSSGGFENIGF